jgi:hypothetical protein
MVTQGCSVTNSEAWLSVLLFSTSLSLASLGLGCNLGQNGQPSSPSNRGTNQQVALSVSPVTTSVHSGNPVQFKANVSGTKDIAVLWTAAIGTIDSNGFYTAPKTSAQVADTIIATAIADRTKTAQARVTVHPPATDRVIALSVAPVTTSVQSGNSVQFTATISGTTNTAVTWAAATGTIDSNGLYTAPKTEAQVVDTVTAIAIADRKTTARASVTVQPQTSQSASIPASFYGMHVNRNSSPWPTVSFASYRSLNSSYINWADINSADQRYDWRMFDLWMSKAQAGGQDVMYTLFGTPSWASSRGINSSNPDYSCSYVSHNGPGVCDPPTDLAADGTGTNQHWKDFVTAIINHVGPGKVKYWEIWNEWNISNQWQGTQAQLLRMAQDAHAILKAADPNALLTSPPVVNADLAAYNWLLPYLQAGGGQYADIIAVHGYVQKRGEVCPSSCPVPELVAAILDKTRAVMAATGQQSKPLFDTEGSWGVSTGMTDPDLEAAFVGRFYLIQLGGTTASKGFDKFYWFGWDYTNTGGLYNPTTGTLTSSGIAYEQIYNWTVGATLSPCTANGTLWSCGITRPGGYQALAIWDTSQSCAKGVCSILSITVDPVYMQYGDLAGNTSVIVNNIVPVSLKPILLQSGNAPAH